MNILSNLCASTLALVSLAASSAAEELCYTVSFPLQVTTWNSTATVPTFQRSLGTLTAVRVTVSSTITGDAQIENLQATPIVSNTFFCADVLVKRPDTSNIVVVVPVTQFVDSLAAFDGVTDFSGTSGITHLSASATATNTSVLSFGADLTLFSNPVGGGFTTVTLPIEARNTAFVSASPTPTSVFPQEAQVSVEVCYVYSAFVSSHCSGDGSSSACPCGNTSATNPAAGCANSSGLGARLTSSGIARVSADSFALVGTSLPVGSVALLFQGTGLENGGFGTVFGDGLRCVNGTIVRLAVRNAGPGVVTYPVLGDPTISAQSSIPANSVRTYQVWYRDSAPFCTASTFNLTQALRVQWQP